MLPVCFNPRARDEREDDFLEVITRVESFNPRARDEREKIVDKQYAGYKLKVKEVTK